MTYPTESGELRDVRSSAEAVVSASRQPRPEASCWRGAGSPAGAPSRLGVHVEHDGGPGRRPPAEVLRHRRAARDRP
jgi:hypothetical protein